MKKSTLSSVLLLAFMLTAVVAATQEVAGPTCAVPLVVNHFNKKTRHLENVQDLGVKDLDVRFGGKAVTPDSVAVDSSPKRVVIVLDATKEIPEPEWKMGLEMATHLVRSARPDDRFALMLTGDKAPAGEWISGAEAAEQFGKLTSARPSTAKRREENYDALMSALRLLNPARFGDAVLFFGHPDDSGGYATPEQVQEAFHKNNVRFYGISFTELPQMMTATSSLIKFFHIGSRTGGSFWLDRRPLSAPEQSQLFKERLLELYAGIAAPYRVTLSPVAFKKRADVEIDVRDMKARNLEPQDIHYPRAVYSCGQSSK